MGISLVVSKDMDSRRIVMAKTYRRIRKSRNPVWTKPKEEDLVLLWNSQLEKHHSRKLESHWTEPHRLVKINPEGISGMASKLYGDQSNLRRTHLDDMKVCCPRSDYPKLISVPAIVSFS